MKRLVPAILVVAWIASAVILMYLPSPEAQQRHVIPTTTDPASPGQGQVWLSTTTANTVKYHDGAASRSLVDLGLTQTLGNKTLTAPVISTIVNTGTLTLPTSTDTLTGRATTDTLTNKTIGDTLASTKACATGYTRVLPNFCRINDQSGTTWTDAVACTGRSPVANPLPADAKSVQMGIRWRALSNNAVGNRINVANFHSTNTCTTSTDVNRSEFSVQEFVATTAGTEIGRFTDHVTVPLVETNTFYSVQSNAGGNGNADIDSFWVTGYFD